MKEFFKKASLPIGVFALAITGAFATNAIKSAQTIVPGYQKMDSEGFVCSDPEVQCTTSLRSEVCTWKDANNTVHQLYGEQTNPVTNETVCTISLYKI